MISVRRVIVGASTTPGSIRAMRYARELAADSGATLIVAHAWEPPGGDFADRRSPSPSLREVWRQAAWGRIRDSVDRAWGGLPAEPRTLLAVTRGPAGAVLVDLASEREDLLVVGAGRRGALARIGHGKVVRYCLAHAQCPVIAVPPAALARLARRRWRGAFRSRGLRVDGVAADLNRPSG